MGNIAGLSEDWIGLTDWFDTLMAKPKKTKLKLPRVPLIQKTGGAHRVQTKVLARKAKHKSRIAKDFDE